MYTLNSRVRYSETDHKGKLSMPALLNYFQDCSTFHSEDIGLGLAYLKRSKRIWLMTAWQIVVNRFPDLCERIVVGTAPYDFKGFFGYRNFLLQTEEGVQLACANSIWTLLNVETGRPEKPPREMTEGYVLSEKLPMEYASRKIEITGSGIKLPLTEVKHHHLDTNNHVNNGQYISMAMECAIEYWRMAGLGERAEIRQMRAEYRKSALLGDWICPLLIEEGDDGLVISLQDEAGRPYCNIEFRYCSLV